jgi:hypothetical protein
MFVEWDCHCKGLSVVQGDRVINIVIDSCDRSDEHEALRFITGDRVTGKNSTPLSAEESLLMCKLLDQQLSAGATFGQVKALLGIKS